MKRDETSDAGPNECPECGEPLDDDGDPVGGDNCWYCPKCPVCGVGHCDQSC